MGARRELNLLMAVLISSLVSCSDSNDGPGSAGDPLTRLKPTAPLPLSPGNETGQDEDPCILIAQDGSLVAAWYSNRLGPNPDGRERKEIFISRSTDGVHWTNPPTQATGSYEWCFYPSLAQDASGDFHLSWMQWHLLPDSCVPDVAVCPGGPNCCTGTDRRILYHRSPDALTWNLGDADTLTPGPADELPALVAASDERLLVYYVSGYRSGDTTRQIFVVVHGPGGWEMPVQASGLSSDLHHDTFPHVVEKSPGEFLMTWTRYDVAEGDNLFNASTKTMLSTSSDGLSWTTPEVVNTSGEPSIDVFPFLYPDHSGQSWFVLWVTEAGVVELPVGGTFPDDLVSLDLPGYTPRVAPTATPGIYWAAWAEGTEPVQKIRYRFFTK
jgi:hypothetical protein